MPIGIAALAGCASRKPAGVNAPRHDDSVAAVACEKADPPWWAVRLGRLRFCVPEGWGQRGLVTWVSASGRITWDTTAYVPVYAPATPTAPAQEVYRTVRFAGVGR